MDKEDNVIDLGGYDSTYDTIDTMSGIDTITLTGTGISSITSPTYATTMIGGGGGGGIYSTTGSSNVAYGVGTGGTYTINTGTSNGTWTTTGTSVPWITTTTTTPGIQVKGNAEFDGDIKVKGKSLNEWMETMEKRLAILVPDPKKLEKFEALQKAYKHYKMLEALCEIEDDKPE